MADPVRVLVITKSCPWVLRRQRKGCGDSTVRLRVPSTTWGVHAAAVLVAVTARLRTAPSCNVPSWPARVPQDVVIPVFVGSGHFRHFMLDRTPLHPDMANETRQRDVTLFFAGGGNWGGRGGLSGARRIGAGSSEAPRGAGSVQPVLWRSGLCARPSE